MKINSSPESFMIRDKNFSIVSCSPETLIDRKGKKIITKPKIGNTEVGLVVAYQKSVIETTPSPKRAHKKRIRRSIRSASEPVNGARRNVGANSANPRRPKSSSLPVMS